jgi:hypothetical protein
MARGWSVRLQVQGSSSMSGERKKKEKLCVLVVLATSLNGWNICVFLEDRTGHLLGFRGSL